MNLTTTWKLNLMRANWPRISSSLSSFWTCRLVLPTLYKHHYNTAWRAAVNGPWCLESPALVDVSYSINRKNMQYATNPQICVSAWNSGHRHKTEKNVTILVKISSGEKRCGPLFTWLQSPGLFHLGAFGERSLCPALPHCRGPESGRELGMVELEWGLR